jgi:hypothetical protein
MLMIPTKSTLFFLWNDFLEILSYHFGMDDDAGLFWENVKGRYDNKTPPTNGSRKRPALALTPFRAG